MEDLPGFADGSGRRVKESPKLIPRPFSRICSAAIRNDLGVCRNVGFSELEFLAQIRAKFGDGFDLCRRPDRNQTHVGFLADLNSDSRDHHIAISFSLECCRAARVIRPAIAEIGEKLVNAAVTLDGKIYRHLSAVTGIREILRIVVRSSSARIVQNYTENGSFSLRKEFGCEITFDVHIQIVRV